MWGIESPYKYNLHLHVPDINQFCIINRLKCFPPKKIRPNIVSVIL